MLWMRTAGTTTCESFYSKPICKPCHVTITVKWVGNQIQRFKADKGVESSRGDTANLIWIKGQAFQLNKSVKQFAVDVPDSIFRKNSIMNNGKMMSDFEVNQTKIKISKCTISKQLTSTYISRILFAPSKAPSSITSILLRLRSRLSNCGSRLNKPRAGTRVILLSFKRSRFAVLGRSNGNSVKSRWAQSTVPPSQ